MEVWRCGTRTGRMDAVNADCDSLPILLAYKREIDPRVNRKKKNQEKERIKNPLQLHTCRIIYIQVIPTEFEVYVGLRKFSDLGRQV